MEHLTNYPSGGVLFRDYCCDSNLLSLVLLVSKWLLVTSILIAILLAAVQAVQHLRGHSGDRSRRRVKIALMISFLILALTALMFAFFE